MIYRIVFLIISIFAYSLGGFAQKSISFCQGELQVNWCEKLDKFSEIVSSRKKYYRTLDATAMESKTPTEKKIAESIDDLINDIDGLRFFIESFNLDDIDEIVELCDDMTSEYYIVKKGTTENKNVSKIVPQIRELVIAERESSEASVAQTNVQAVTQEKNMSTKGLSENRPNKPEKRETGTGSKEGETESASRRGLMDYLKYLFLLVGVGLFAFITLYRYKTKIKDLEQKNFELVRDKGKVEKQNTSLEKSNKELKNESEIKSKRISELEENEIQNEVPAQYSSMENTVNLSNDDSHEVSRGAQIEFAEYRGITVFKYHHVLEDDQPFRLKVSRSRIDRGPKSVYQFYEEGDRALVSIIEDIKVSTRLRGYMKDRVLPLFNFAESDSRSGSVIQTKKEAVFVLSNDGEFWGLKDKGEIIML